MVGKEGGNSLNRGKMLANEAQPQLIFYCRQKIPPAFARPCGRGDIGNVQKEHYLGQWHVGVE